MSVCGGEMSDPPIGHELAFDVQQPAHLCGDVTV